MDNILEIGKVYYTTKVDKEFKMRHFEPSSSRESWEDIHSIDPVSTHSDYESFVNSEKKIFEQNIGEMEIRFFTYNLTSPLEIDITKKRITDVESKGDFVSWEDEELIEALVNY